MSVTACIVGHCRYKIRAGGRGVCPNNPREKFTKLQSHVFSGKNLSGKRFTTL